MIKRNRESVLREYDQEKWPSVLSKIDEVLSRGETSLSRVISLTLNELRDNSSNKNIDVVFKGRAPVKIPASFAYGGNQVFISNKIISSCESEELTIVELGSGYGRNLFWLWLQGGPKHAKYVACEITEMGRKCTNKLSELVPDMKVDAQYFDFNMPNLKSIVKDSKNILFFTCHAIEQIPYISEDIFDELINIDGKVKCIHFEPVGWQVRQSKKISDMQGSEEKHAEKHDYNRNLWETLCSLEKQEKIVIDEVEPEVMGINPLNGTSIISWHKPQL